MHYGSRITVRCGSMKIVDDLDEQPSGAESSGPTCVEQWLGHEEMVMPLSFQNTLP